jgi:hypothetical protein
MPFRRRSNAESTGNVRTEGLSEHEVDTQYIRVSKRLPPSDCRFDELSRQFAGPRRENVIPPRK